MTAMRKFRTFPDDSANGYLDLLLSFPTSRGTGVEHQKAPVGATGRIRQGTKSLRSGPLRGGMSREGG
jgi:hypothetical protein